MSWRGTAAGVAAFVHESAIGEWTVPWAIYRCPWWVVVSAGTAYGLLMSIVHLVPAEVVLIGGGVAAQSLVGWLVWRGGSRPQKTPVLAAGALYPVLTLAPVGVVLAHGWAGVATACALCLGGFLLRRRLRRSTGVLRDESSRVPAPVGPPGPAWVGVLSTAELCRGWEITTAALPRLGTTTQREIFVRLRAQCLDELERRDPRGFDRWLREGWADADPSPYFGTAAEP